MDVTLFFCQLSDASVPYSETHPQRKGMFHRGRNPGDFTLEMTSLLLL